MDVTISLFNYNIIFNLLGYGKSKNGQFTQNFSKKGTL